MAWATLRTFSKIYGLAGVRIGYGFAREELITNLLKVKLPFEPSTLAQAAGIAALADKDQVLARSEEAHRAELKAARGTWQTRFSRAVEIFAGGFIAGVLAR
jgi:histidinol-phosphate/aromatic aminotransferase/cobyric acid decarboxylase-like protein